MIFMDDGNKRHHNWATLDTFFFLQPDKIYFNNDFVGILDQQWK